MKVFGCYETGEDTGWWESEKKQAARHIYLFFTYILICLDFNFFSIDMSISYWFVNKCFLVSRAFSVV